MMDRMHVPTNCRNPLLISLTAFGLGATLCYLLRGLAVPGGDTGSILSPHWTYLWTDRLVWYMREPLGHFLPLIAFWRLHAVVPAFQLVAAILGGLWLAVLLRFTAHAGFLLVCLLSAITLNFIGHVEFYGPVVVALTLYFLLLTRALEPEPRAHPGSVVLAFGLAYLCHKLTLVFAPTLLWLVLRRVENGWAWRPWSRRVWEQALLTLIAITLIDIAPGILQILCPDRVLVVMRSDSLWELLTPLTPGMGRAIAARSPTGVFFFFSLGQWRHWVFFLGFWLAGAPLGLVVLAACRRRLRGDPALALASAGLLALIWTFFWHPHMGWWDWDLFTVGALPVNLLAGGLWAGLFGGASVNRPCRGGKEPGKRR